MAPAVSFSKFLRSKRCLPLPPAHTRSKSHLHHLRKRRKLEATICAAESEGDSGTSGEDSSSPLP